MAQLPPPTARCEPVPLANGVPVTSRQLWRLVGALGACVAIAVGWQAFDLDRHEDQGWHRRAGETLSQLEARIERLERLEYDVKDLQKIVYQMRGRERP